MAVDRLTVPGFGHRPGPAQRPGSNLLARLSLCLTFKRLKAARQLVMKEFYVFLLDIVSVDSFSFSTMY